MKIKQKHYADIKLDLSEEDTVLIWQVDKSECNVIFIERDKTKQLIKVLEKAIIPEHDCRSEIGHSWLPIANAPAVTDVCLICGKIRNK